MDDGTGTADWRWSRIAASDCCTTPCAFANASATVICSRAEEGRDGELETDADGGHGAEGGPRRQGTK